MSQFALLSKRRFLPLFAAQFLGAFNDNVFKNALVILLTYRAGAQAGVDPRLLVTAAAGIFILPFFLFSAAAGHIADAYEKTQLIRIIKFVELPLMLLAAAGFFLGNYWMLLFVLFLVGVQAAFFGPLKYSILPEHLAEKELIGGNALIEAGTFIAILLGTILGGLLVLKDGGIAAVSTIIILTAAAGWASAFRIPPSPQGTGKAEAGFNIVTQTWRLVRDAAKDKDVFLSILGISWFWLVGFTFLAQFPVYAQSVIGADEGVVTLFLTVFSVGIAIGSLICNRLVKGEVSGAFVPLGAFGMTAGILLFWLASPAAVSRETLIGVADFVSEPRYLAVLACLVSTAIFGGIYIVPLYTIMQTRCDAAHRSRTVAANNVVNALFMVLGAVITMLLLKLHVGVTEIFLIIGLANIPAALLVRRLVHLRREARRAA